MNRVYYKPTLAVAAAVSVVGLHVALNAVFRTQEDPISYVFFLVCSLGGVIVCARNILRSPKREQRNWVLAGMGLLLWFTATVLAARAELWTHEPTSSASIDDFFYFFCGIPFLVAIASHPEDQFDSLFFWMDGLQAAAAGYLVYVAVFSALPFSGSSAAPLPVDRLVVLLNFERYTLAALSTGRLAASAVRTRERQFFTVLTVFLWAWAICESAYNHMVLQYNDAGVLDALVDVPFLAFVFAAVFMAKGASAAQDEGPREPLAFIADQVRPALLGLALVALSSVVARDHFRLAMGTILGAFAVYGVRLAILQRRLLSAQVELEAARDRLAKQAMQDGLTGIANRRCFDQQLDTEWKRSQRSRAPLSLLLIDIDRFKKLNDTNGHMVGDESLVQVAGALNDVTNRASDLVARYGGDEFMALLPGTDAAGARKVAERMRVLVGNTPPVAGLKRQVTLSVGGTTWDGQEGASVEALVETADRALYRAKQNGRNRVEFLAMEGRVAG